MSDLFTDTHALALDDRDPLPTLRGEFHLPLHDGAADCSFCCQ